MGELLGYHAHLDVSGNAQLAPHALTGCRNLFQLVVGCLQFLVGILQTLGMTVPTVQEECQVSDGQQGDEGSCPHDDTLVVLSLLLSLHFRQVFTQLQVLVVCFQAVVLQSYGSMCQLDVAVLQHQVQCLFRQFFLLQLVSDVVQLQLLVGQTQVFRLVFCLGHF